MNAERDPDRRRVHRRRPLVRRRGRRATPRERVVFGRPIGAEPGRPVPDRAGARRDRGGRPDALQGRLALRAGPAVRAGGEHGEAARLRGLLGRPPTPASTRTAASASPRSTTSSASSARRASTRSRRSPTTSCSPTSASTCSGCRGRTEMKYGLFLTTPTPRTGTRTTRSTTISPRYGSRGTSATTPCSPATTSCRTRCRWSSCGRSSVAWPPRPATCRSGPGSCCWRCSTRSRSPSRRRRWTRSPTAASCSAWASATGGRTSPHSACRRSA